MRRAGHAVGAAALVLGLLAALAAGQQPPQHVVVVVLDDVGIDKVGAYGHPTAGPTPVLDVLAATGLRFTSAYADPRCSPSRCAMLTGRYGSRTGIGSPVPVYDPASDPFLPAATEPWLPLQIPARSYLAGKWHLTHTADPDYHTDPLAKGFTWWRGHLVNPQLAQGEGLYSWKKQINGGEVTVSTFITTDNALEAWNALSASAGQSSLVWLALQAAHPPWDETPPAGLYTPVGGPQTQAKRQQYSLQAGDTLLGQLMLFYAQQLPTDFATTIWIVLGDNGTPSQAIEAPEPPSHGKGTVYQGGVHVPLIVWGSGVTRGVTDELVHAVDVWATVIDLFDATRPSRPRSDSISFAPVIAGGAGGRAVVYCRAHEPNGVGPYTLREHCATDGHWKLLEHTTGAPELYALDLDPYEQVDLWPPSTPAENAAVALLQPVIDASSTP